MELKNTQGVNATQAHPRAPAYLTNNNNNGETMESQFILDITACVCRR